MKNVDVTSVILALGFGVGGLLMGWSEARWTGLGWAICTLLAGIVLGRPTKTARSLDAVTSVPHGVAHARGSAPDGHDPGKQALAMLQRGDNCDWYSIRHTNEMHEAFDCLEIYWRTNVEHPEQNEFGYGRGPFELKAGFRVRWHVAATHHSYVEAVGLDLLTTILEARDEADRLVARGQVAKAMGHKHPKLEAWKASGEKRDYSFHGLSLDKWYVRVDFPGGLCWVEHPDLEQAVAEVLAKASAVERAA